MNKTLLLAAILHGPLVVAADGAADRLLKCGVMPDAVIGDFDSFSDAARRAIPRDRLFPIAEQDSTDFEKCLSRIDAPLVIGVGFSGGRLDHQLAVLHGMMRHASRACVLIGRRDLVFLTPPKLKLELPGHSRVSLFPMAPVAARSTGLHWPLDGVGLQPGQQIGTSNRVAGPKGRMTRVTITADAPALLSILPVARLDCVVAALGDPGLARWSVR